MQHFFKILGKLFHNHGPAVREASFQIIGAWFGQGQPSLRVPVSCKQSDAERKDFADIPEQGHSESLRGLERCRSTGW